MQKVKLDLPHILCYIYPMRWMGLLAGMYWTKRTQSNLTQRNVMKHSPNALL